MCVLKVSCILDSLHVTTIRLSLLQHSSRWTTGQQLCARCVVKDAILRIGLLFRLSFANSVTSRLPLRHWDGRPPRLQLFLITRHHLLRRILRSLYGWKGNAICCAFVAPFLNRGMFPRSLWARPTSLRRLCICIRCYRVYRQWCRCFAVHRRAGVVVCVPVVMEFITTLLSTFTCGRRRQPMAQ